MRGSVARCERRKPGRPSMKQRKPSMPQYSPLTSLTCLPHCHLRTLCRRSDDDDDDILSSLLARYSSDCAHLTFGSLVGYCAGSASRELGKAVAVTIGMGYMAVQAMAYSGYLNVNWKKVRPSTRFFFSFPISFLLKPLTPRTLSLSLYKYIYVILYRSLAT